MNMKQGRMLRNIFAPFIPPALHVWSARRLFPAPKRWNSISNAHSFMRYVSFLGELCLFLLTLGAGGNMDRTNLFYKVSLINCYPSYTFCVLRNFRWLLEIRSLFFLVFCSFIQTDICVTPLFDFLISSLFSCPFFPVRIGGENRKP